MTTAKNTPSVYPKSIKASFFFPSIYHRIGLPKNNAPHTAAENTKSINIIIGINAVSGPRPNMSGAKWKKMPTNIT